MSVGEITARTLELAREGDRVEALFAERNEDARRTYAKLNKDAGKPVDWIKPLLVRVTAHPNDSSGLDSCKRNRFRPRPSASGDDNDGLYDHPDELMRDQFRDRL